MKYIFILFLVINFSLFVVAQSPLDKVDFYTVDKIDVDASFQNPKFQNYYNKRYDEKVFFDKYFYPWAKNKKRIADAIGTSNAFDAFFNYNDKLTACHTGNYSAYSSKFIAGLLANTNRAAYPNVLEYGMVLARADIRQLPTEEYCWKRVRSAGEGYPFDYFQETSLWVATPVLVLHRSEDGLWYFVESAYSKGWVKAEKIGLISKQQRADLMRRKYVAILKDDLVVATKTHPVRLRVGTLLPMEQDDTSLLPRANGKQTSFETIKLNSSVAQQMPLIFNADNIKTLLPELLGGKYSWGGIDGGRDCSSTIKDLMTPFGIWLPRNSSQQHQIGHVTSLKGTKTEKFAQIEAEGVPFLSIIYKRGHAMLYLGQNEANQPLIFHNVWGLKPIISDETLVRAAQQREAYGLFGVSGADLFSDEVSARYIIGRAVITTSDPEQHFPRSKKLKFKYFMDAIQSINCIVD